MLFANSHTDFLAKREPNVTASYSHNEQSFKKLKQQDSYVSIKASNLVNTNSNRSSKNCKDAMLKLKQMKHTEKILNSLNEQNDKINENCSKETKNTQECNRIPENQKELIFTSSPWSKSLKRISSCGDSKKTIEYLGKNYFGGETHSILMSKNEKSFFTGEENGNLIQRCILNKKKYNYGQILYSISDFKHHPNQHDVFLCGRGFKANFGGHQMVQFSLKERKIVKSFGEVQSHSSDVPIQSYPEKLAVTSDAKYIYVATTLGFLKKYSIETGNLVKDFGQIFGKVSLLKSFKLTPDNKYLIALTQDCKLFKFSLQDDENINQICLNFRTKYNADSYTNSEMIITKDSKHLYFGIDSKIIKLNISLFKIVKEINVAEHGGTVWSLALTKCGKFLYCGTSFAKEELPETDAMLQEDLESLSDCSYSSDMSLSSYRGFEANQPKGRLLKFEEKRGLQIKNFGDIHKQAVSNIIVN